MHDARVSAGERARVAGIPVTAVPRTLLDLAAVLDADRLVRAWEEADRFGLLCPAGLRRVCEESNGRRGTGPIRRLVSEADVPLYSRSALEEAFATFCARQALPMPAFNATVLDREVDGYWPHACLAVELDGYAFHGHRAAFEWDRERDAAFQVAGIRVVRLTHRRLTDKPDEVAAQLRHLLGTK